MKFINFLVVKLAVSFAAGIITGYYLPISFSFILKSLCLLCIIITIVWIRERNKLQPGMLFGILVYAAFFTLGIANFEARQPENSNRDYANFHSGFTSEVFQLKITQVLKSNTRYLKYYAKVLQSGQYRTQGGILLNIPRDSLGAVYGIDDLLLVLGQLEPIRGPLNPHQFDYRKYLRHEGIHHQIRLSEDGLLASKKGSTTLVGLASKIRLRLIQKLSDQPIGAKERSIMQALLLGERSAIEKDLYSQYAAAGALHILAVSGLHVGIIFLMLSRLFSPLERFNRGKSMKILLIVSFLWGFALLAGLSASVVRAVTMFSLFALAGLLKRPTNGFNTLFLSFFILLIANPAWIFHVGFQFSYLAVFSILWIQPKLYKCYIPKFKLDKQLWSIGTVTLSAQIGIAPLSIYYFHQFPGLFFLSNLVILPFLGIILFGGIGVLFLSAWNALPDSMAFAYNQLIQLLNDFVVWVARQEAFLFKDISFSSGKLIASYLIIVSLVLFFMERRAKRIILILSSVCLLLGVIIWEKKVRSAEEFVVYHASNATVMGHRTGSMLRLMGTDSVSFANRFPVKDYRIGTGVLKVSSEEIPDVFQFKGKSFLIIDSLAVFPSEEIDILLIIQSPKIHLERILDSLKPELIIADGSNFPWDVKRWHATCELRKLDFHHTLTKGAFIMKGDKVSRTKEMY